MLKAPKKKKPTSWTKYEVDTNGAVYKNTTGNRQYIGGPWDRSGWYIYTSSGIEAFQTVTKLYARLKMGRV